MQTSWHEFAKRCHCSSSVRSKGGPQPGVGNPDNCPTPEIFKHYVEASISLYSCQIQHQVSIILPPPKIAVDCGPDPKYTFGQVFLRCFTDPIRVPRISENYHRVPRIREIGSLHVHTGYLIFSLIKTCMRAKKYYVSTGPIIAAKMGMRQITFLEDVCLANHKALWQSNTQK